jgi:stage II sporulation protein R
MRKQTFYQRYLYLLLAIIFLVFSWEANSNHSIIMASGSGKTEAGNAAVEIPQESIRLRILANSDSPADQWIKREVRNVIVEQMKQWVTEPQGIEAARATIRTHLSELDELVGLTLHNYGFTSSYKVELGVVPFPAKMYGSQIYPAGDYETLRVSIGSAEGQNWWCVLFPPLCFIDSEVIAKKPESTGDQAKASSGIAEGQRSAMKEQISDNNKSLGIQQKSVQPEVHFFVWDFFKKWFS